MGSSIVPCKLHELLDPLLDSIIQAIQKCIRTIQKYNFASLW